MQIRGAALSVLIALAAGAAPALADSVAVTSGPNGTTVSNGQPCRVVTTHDNNGGNTNSTSITAGNGGVSGQTSVGGAGNGSSVTVGSGSSSNGAQSSAGAGSDCVIHRNEPGK